MLVILMDTSNDETGELVVIGKAEELVVVLLFVRVIEVVVKLVENVVFIWVVELIVVKLVVDVGSVISVVPFVVELYVDRMTVVLEVMVFIDIDCKVSVIEVFVVVLFVCVCVVVVVKLAMDVAWVVSVVLIGETVLLNGVVVDGIELVIDVDDVVVESKRIRIIK